MRAVYIYFIIFIFSLVETQAQFSKMYFDESIPTNEANIPLDSTTFYFPERLITDIKLMLEISDKNNYLVKPDNSKSETNISRLRKYSAQLYAMQEPLLFNKQTEKEAYRFMVLRSTEHPVMIRIEKEGNAYYLYWKTTSGYGAGKPGKILVDKKKRIKKADWEYFTDKFKLTDHTTVIMPVADVTEYKSVWVIETYKPREYHITTIATPQKNGDFQKAFRYLVSLTNLEIKKSDIY